MEQSDVNETLEELDLPKPAMSYEEATTWGPEGDPSIIMAGAEEYAKLADGGLIKTLSCFDSFSPPYQFSSVLSVSGH